MKATKITFTKKELADALEVFHEVVFLPVMEELAIEIDDAMKEKEKATLQ